MIRPKRRTFEDDPWPGRYWRGLDGSFHRISGPAVERDDGSKEWWLDGSRKVMQAGWRWPVRRGSSSMWPCIELFPGYGAQEADT